MPCLAQKLCFSLQSFYIDSSIAGDFTKYDEHAVKQINRNIELIRYKKYKDANILFELVNAQVVKVYIDNVSDIGTIESLKIEYKTFRQYLDQSDDVLKKLYNTIDDYIFGLGDDVQEKELKSYKAYKLIKNFVCLEVRPKNKNILLYLKLDYSDIEIKEEFIRDVRSIRHYGTGDVEVRISNVEEFEKIKYLISRSYELS